MNRNVPPSSVRSSSRRAWWLGAGCALLVAAVAGGWLLLAGRPPGPAPEGMVWVPGGWFRMGSDFFADAGPIHRVRIDGFWMDRHEVTNEQFAAFVAATGYKTYAERVPTAEDIPGARPEQLVPCSLVFSPPPEMPLEGLHNCERWWKVVPGACWKHPAGPGSDLSGKEKHPVVHICWHDAVAYAEWAGKRLPTEAEWERAARGGLEDQPYYWGAQLRPADRWMANFFQGTFPLNDTADDGHRGTAPVGSYPPNAYGLYDLCGNAWEWCADWYRPGYEVPPDGTRDNPAGPPSSRDTHGNNEPKRVQRGGSFLCTDEYCARYRAGGRMEGEPKTGQSHAGFRCVLSPKKN